MRDMGLVLCTIFAVGNAVSSAAWCATSAPKKPPLLHLQETDRFTIRIHQGSDRKEVKFSELLGVGKDAPDGKAGTFDVTVTDSLPAGDRLFPGQGNPLKVQTVDGKPFSVPWQTKVAGQTRTVSFRLKGVPYVGASGKACCGCGNEGSCGGACALEWSYDAASEVHPNGWGNVSYTVSPTRLVAGRDNKVTVTLRADAGHLEDGWLALHVAPKQESAATRIDKFPDGFKQQQCSCGANVAEGHLSDKPQTVAVDLVITPSKPGKLVIKDAVRAGGTLKGVTYPRAAVTPGQEAARTEQTAVTYLGDLVLSVE